jgi:hypothetical protein
VGYYRTVPTFAASFAFLTLIFCVQLPFPIKLHDMLEGMANNGSQYIVSWQPHGKAFRVHQPDVFAKAIMPRYFNQTKYKSFLRQLHLYGFQRISKGMDKGAYFHSLFIKNNKSMGLRMLREKIKGTAGKKNEIEEVPNFYKEMVIMENHLPTNRDFATMAKPSPNYDFSGVTPNSGVTPISAYNNSGVRLVSWPEMNEQNISSSSFKKDNSFTNFQFSTGNVTSAIVKEHIADGEEVFFEGKKFHFVET